MPGQPLTRLLALPHDVMLHVLKRVDENTLAVVSTMDEYAQDINSFSFQVSRMKLFFEPPVRRVLQFDTAHQRPLGVVVSNDPRTATAKGAYEFYIYNIIYKRFYDLTMPSLPNDFLRYARIPPDIQDHLLSSGEYLFATVGITCRYTATVKLVTRYNNGPFVFSETTDIDAYPNIMIEQINSAYGVGGRGPNICDDDEKIRLFWLALFKKEYFI